MNQVVDALWELTVGLNEARAGALLKNKEDKEVIHREVITVILRLVFLLFVESRDNIPSGELYEESRSIGRLADGLYEDYLVDSGSMETQFDAWKTLMSLFVDIYGGKDGYPARYGGLFNPVNHRVLINATINNKSVERVLRKLLRKGGEKIDYSLFHLEQMGSMYEEIIGFRVDLVNSTSVGIVYKPPRQSNSITLLFEAEILLSQSPNKRDKWLDDHVGVSLKLSDSIKKSISEAETIEEVCLALGNRLSPFTPCPLAAGSLHVKPTKDRRRSGSHYTPRELTDPIVAEAFRPWLERCGYHPTADQILELKVCDPAMGSGAFLLAVCRFLSKLLIESWDRDGCPFELTSEMDREVYSKHLIVRKCLYGVDNNSLTVELAKLSLWLAGFLKEEPFTLVDHSLKIGDSLVGLSKSEIIEAVGIKREVDREYLSTVGDILVAAFFNGKNSKERKVKRDVYLASTVDCDSAEELEEIMAEPLEALREGEKGIQPLHWDIAFPYVFERERPGFDVFVGNPPFLGGRRVSEIYGLKYNEWLTSLHAEANRSADLSAHFFRRCFAMLRSGGAMGLIATNTIAQGETRSTGLRWISLNGGTIYAARKRTKWPGMAAVVVSVVHLHKGTYAGIKLLERRPVEQITAFLFANGGHEDPKTLKANEGKSFQGSIVLGMGFTFDDSGEADDGTPGIPSPIATMERLIAENPKNAEVIFPYIGGEEVNSSPIHAHHRFVINFGLRSEAECRQEWPELMEVAERKVKDERLSKAKEVAIYPWWQHWRPRPELYAAIAGCERALAIALTSNAVAATWIHLPRVFAHSLGVISLDSSAVFSVLQSCLHRFWAYFTGSSMKDDLRYTPSDCFETFPFPAALIEGRANDPAHAAQHQRLVSIGEHYHEFRAALMVANNEGLTKTYNRFHAPEEDNPGILELRRLHTQMDQIVLNAYGWSDIPTTCGYGFDYLDTEEDAELPTELQDRIDSGELHFETADDACDFEAQLRAYGAVKTSRRLPWRYRWPDAVREEVLARLLALNAERYAEEVAQGLHG